MMQKLTLAGKALLGLLVGTLIATSLWAISLATHKPTPPPPAPQLIEWEVDDYGEKIAKLPNGLSLYVSSTKDEDGTDTTWTWSVSGVAATEQEAKRAVLHLGGVR